jgi:hypothetical protein
VTGARVKLGQYTTETTRDGRYTFRNVPRGEYDLALDAQFLPADYAWDDRRQHLAVTPAYHENIDLRVAPLNTVHGRIYCDRNGNGRFDAGEAAIGVPVQLADHVTVTDTDGAYSFYNVWPGSYVVHLVVDKLPSDMSPAGAIDLPVVLGDDRPVTGADFLLVIKTKPIVWREDR